MGLSVLVDVRRHARYVCELLDVEEGDDLTLIIIDQQGCCQVWVLRAVLTLPLVAVEVDKVRAVVLEINSFSGRRVDEAFEALTLVPALELLLDYALLRLVIEVPDGALVDVAQVSQKRVERLVVIDLHLRIL